MAKASSQPPLRFAWQRPFCPLDPGRRAVREESLSRRKKTTPCETAKEGGGNRLSMTNTDSYFHSTMASGGCGNCEPYLTGTKEEVTRRRGKQDSQDEVRFTEARPWRGAGITPGSRHRSDRRPGNTVAAVFR